MAQHSRERINHRASVGGFISIARRQHIPAGCIAAAWFVLVCQKPALSEAAAVAVTSARPTPEQAKFFENQVRPLLAERCFKCHGPEKQKSDLRLDSLSGMLTGGKSGPAIVPGKPDESKLVDAINYRSLEMPPTGKLADEQIALLTSWVKMGAPWPGDQSTPASTTRRPGHITDPDRAYWAYQRVRKPEVPAVADNGWGRNPIDAFVFARLQSAELTPAPEADRAALVRRLYFDLWGLPPTPEETEAFVNDRLPQAYDRLLDRLLDSPRYAEHWARHWLDLARYAESDGFKQDAFRENAWRYRDYVIRAFNDDKPYNRFVEEQLAGDELDPESTDAQIATGFLRQTIYEYNQRNVPRQRADILNELTDVTADVFLATGMGCARCHDHKFDPILQRDYYRFQAFFAPLVWRDDVPVLPAAKRADYQKKLADWEAATADIHRDINKLKLLKLGKGGIKFPDDVQAMLLKPTSERTIYEELLCRFASRQEDTLVREAPAAGDKKRIDELEHELAKFNDLKPGAVPLTMGVADVGPVAPPTSKPAPQNSEVLEPGFPEVLGVTTPPIHPLPTSPRSTGRRAVLARWIASADNPLTARVMVNRIWQYHFGRGLVATSSDFGRLGEKCMHPELLDWLASEFVQRGWSIKQIQRLILSSATYRQSALQKASKTALRKDPQNYLLWRQNCRRLDAEQIRDAALAVANELDLKEFGPSVPATKPRRTVYTTVLRNTHDPLLEVFDAPDGYSSIAQRNTTTTPIQTLLMINGDWMLGRAKALEARLEKREFPSEASQIDYVYRLIFGRRPTTAEVETTAKFLHEQRQRIGHNASSGVSNLVQTMPQREGNAAVIDPESPRAALHVPDNPGLPSGDFTIEAYVMLQSVFADTSVRVIAGQWDGNQGDPGWLLGVTGEKSKYKARNLMLRLSAKDPGDHSYEVVASDIQLDLKKPYYVGASVHMSNPNDHRIVFYAKELSDNDAGLIVKPVTFTFNGSARGPWPFTIGGLTETRNSVWDGLIDDVRLTAAALEQKQLLWEDGDAGQQCAGYWKFENTPGFERDSSGKGNDLVAGASTENGSDDPVRRAVLVDLCHVLLNSSEFLYVD